MRVALAALLVLAASPRAEALEPLPPPRIVIVGDSTASAYGAERAPRTGWGQVLDRFFDPRIAVLNRTQSGRSSRSFVEEGWFDRVAAELRAGDLLLIQFGHNDEKRDAPERYVAPDAFPQSLERYLELARTRGARAVLLTPTPRRNFQAGEPAATHGPYAEAVRTLAAARGVPLLDVEARMHDSLRALGEEPSKALYLHGSDRGAPDDTHFHERGATLVACLVADELVKQKLLDRAALVRDTDCGARPDVREALRDQTRPSGIAHEADIARKQPGPHGGTGETTAYPFFADAPGMDFVFRKRVLHKGAAIGLHQHTHDEIYYVISGRGLYTLDGKDQEIGAGDALLTRTGSTHATRQVGGEDLVLLIMYKPEPAR